MMSLYGDMDISLIKEKPSMRKKIITLSKPEKKLNEVINYLKKNINKKIKFLDMPILLKSQSF